MCIAILKRKNGNITDEQLRECFINNPDGAGIAYTKDNQLFIVKGIFDVKTFINEVRTAENICDNNMLIHCRIGTSGVKNAFNTHPFLINEHIALIHNGILDIKVPKGSLENDTQLFIKRYLADIDKYTIMHNKAVHELINKCIGGHNKFVLLDNTGYYKIINEDAGHWKNNVWFSNYSYEPRKYTSSRNYYYNFYDDDCIYGRDYIYPKQGKFKFNKNNVNETKAETEEVLCEQDLYYSLYDELEELTYEDYKKMGDMPVLYKRLGVLIPAEEIDDVEDENQYELLCDFSETMYGYYLELKDIILGSKEEENKVA